MSNYTHQTLVALLSFGCCVVSTGCFSCTEVRQPPSQVIVQPQSPPAPVVVPAPAPGTSSSSSTTTTTTTTSP